MKITKHSYPFPPTVETSKNEKKSRQKRDKNINTLLTYYKAGIYLKYYTHHSLSQFMKIW